MSWPQKITRSSYELINFYMSNSANWMHFSLHFTHFTELRKIFNCFRACDKVSAECGTEMICSSRYETPGCASFDNRWSRFISFHSITFHSYSSFLLPTTGPQMILNDARSIFLHVVHTSFSFQRLKNDSSWRAPRSDQLRHYACPPPGLVTIWRSGVVIHWYRLWHCET